MTADIQIKYFTHKETLSGAERRQSMCICEINKYLYPKSERELTGSSYIHIVVHMCKCPTGPKSGKKNTS